MAEPVGSEILVNTGVNDAQKSPEVVRLSDGRILIVWDDDQTESARGQLFTAAGVKIGGELALTEEFEERPAVAALGTGFVVVSADNSPTRPLIAQRFDANGAALGAEIVLQTRAGENNVFLFDVEELDGGGFVVAWYYADPFVSGRLLRVQTFDESGNPTSAAQQVNAATESFPSDVDVIALPGGGFQVVWIDSPTIGGDSDVVGRRYGPTFQPLTPGGVQLNATDAGLQTLADAATLVGGGTVAAWYSAGTGDIPSSGIFAQRFDAAGAAVGDEFKVSAGRGAGEPVIAGLDNGGFAIAWVGFFDEPGVPDVGIFAQEFDATGAKVGAERVVNTTLTGGQGEPDIIATAGGFVVVWEDPSRTGGDASQSAVRAQFFSTASAPAGPSAGDDQLKGGPGADTIDGLGGADLIEGFEGDDVLSGSGGNDWLVGGMGDDQLDPGDGVNVLDGGDGLDFASFASRSAGVWADLSAGAFSDATTWATYRSLEGLIGSSAADALFGDGNANTLRGGAGGDALDGRAGTDVLEGGDGDDYLVGGDGTDILRGGAGVDTLTGGAGADLFHLGAAAGWDVATDFDAGQGDRIQLGAGQAFEFLVERDANGDGVADTQLSWSGGTFVALGVSGLDLAAWNALVV